MKIKKGTLIICIVLLIALIYGLTYIPHKIVSINPKDVSKISFLNGNTGESVEITENREIEHIINNLNNITFKKDKLSIGYVGYTFKTTIYNSKGEVIKKLIINSNDYIRYKGFFYIAKVNTIDYDYIENLFQ